MATIEVYDSESVIGILEEEGFKRSKILDNVFLIYPKQDTTPVGEYHTKNNAATIIIGSEINTDSHDFKDFLTVLSRCYISGSIKIVT